MWPDFVQLTLCRVGERTNRGMIPWLFQASLHVSGVTTKIEQESRFSPVCWFQWAGDIGLHLQDGAQTFCAFFRGRAMQFGSF